MDFTPQWLDVADVKTWLRYNGGDTYDDDVLTMAAASVEPYVQRCRRDLFVYHDPDTPNPPDPPPITWPAVYTPDAEVYQAAVELAARTARLRNSSGGVLAFGTAISYATQENPMIPRALHAGPSQMPGVG